jgi:hypothetical protein
VTAPERPEPCHRPPVMGGEGSGRRTPPDSGFGRHPFLSRGRVGRGDSWLSLLSLGGRGRSEGDRRRLHAAPLSGAHLHAPFRRLTAAIGGLGQRVMGPLSRRSRRRAAFAREGGGGAGSVAADCALLVSPQILHTPPPGFGDVRFEMNGA